MKTVNNGLRTGTAVWVQVSESETGRPMLKAGYVVNARKDKVRVSIAGTPGSMDVSRNRVRRAAS